MMTPKKWLEQGRTVIHVLPPGHQVRILSCNRSHSINISK